MDHILIDLQNVSMLTQPAALSSRVKKNRCDDILTYLHSVTQKLDNSESTTSGVARFDGARGQ